MSQRPVNPLLEKIASVLSTHGFCRKGSTFYKEQAELNGVINLQKSAFGNAYYLNVAFYDPKLLQTGKYPKEFQCHVRLRAEGVSGVVDAEVKDVFDGAHSTIDMDKRIQILTGIVEQCVKFLERGGTYCGLRTMLKDNQLRRAAILATFRARLEK